jgi:hypothetical protein
MKLSSKAAAAAIGLLVVPTTAFAARGPLAAPSRSGALRSLESAYIAFPLPDRFSPSHSINTNQKLSGVFEHAVPAGTTTCFVQFAARGQLQRDRPDIHRAAEAAGERGFKISESGQHGPLHWYLGRSAEGLAAFAWRAAPARLRTSRRRYVLFQMTLETRASTTTCPGPVDAERPTLRAAIRRVTAQTR